ncbi:MAG: type I methionyl aminopeptidase [Chloroflexi bacterium]|nr:type I methionyl aminopeptidase [Chloroflexota bacterium]
MIPLRTDADQTINLKSPRELAIMREAGAIVAATLAELRKAAQPGVTTKELDDLAAESLARHDAKSTALGYYGFPAHICISVNHEVVHGIPGRRKLREGDLVKFDVAARYRGYVADTAASVPVGKIRPEVARLAEVTEQALMQSLQYARAGNRLTDISHAIQVYVEQHGLSVVRVFVGHGVGREMHEPPQVPHFGPPGKGPVLKVGMCLAVEPQVNLGRPDVRILKDGWTAVTADGSWSAHFEHTVAITPDGPWILTAPSPES